MSVLPIDLPLIIERELEAQRRPPDGLMHPSSHLLGSLRHAQLDVAGAPQQGESMAQMITLWTGTMWHDWLERTIQKLGVPAMFEVNLTPWMPAGWGGTADAFIWSPHDKAFVLLDIKTTKGEGMFWIRRDGAKPDHVWQLSTYWHAARMAGIPLVRTCAVCYLPKNDTSKKDEVIEPLLVEFTPLPWEHLRTEMESRREAVDDYLASLEDRKRELKAEGFAGPFGAEPAHWLTPALHEVQPRVQKLVHAGDAFELKLAPHWSAAYCKFDVDLCDCSTQGTTKIGTWERADNDVWIYQPRAGYEDIEPTLEPTV